MQHCHPSCHCAVCALVASGVSIGDAVDRVERDEQRQLDEHGFIIHYVYEEGPATQLVNIHTHGLLRDFQIVVPLPPSRAVPILKTLATRSLACSRYRAGQHVRGVIRDYAVALVDAVESGRSVLRVIIPAADGILDRDAMSPPWSYQWNDIPRAEVQ